MTFSDWKKIGINPANQPEKIRDPLEDFLSDIAESGICPAAMVSALEADHAAMAIIAQETRP